MIEKNSEKTFSFVDKLREWIEGLDEYARQARASGASEKNPVLFQEFVPRLKQLGNILLEGEEEEEECLAVEPQMLGLRASTVANLRAYLLERNDPVAYGLFLSLEADLTGESEEVLDEQFQAIFQAATQEERARKQGKRESR